ncbi:phosphate/phosphite/phosphonate ABC transporter substrate-binding protein [Thioalkalivibrio sp. HL-Eb18]|uniref:phosphate/phosphite/phosphonate ABC transporter substrate-binding protein n=1 Tax=Thioalkalivibrio sp. HL-Eb18 TaxID=1266913 RepID=UPI0006864DE5|nr:PhnD/SsuA/transferrin family substrate-binding protein [Thioalkalivibrio sp. HL-Eb18]
MGKRQAGLPPLPASVNRRARLRTIGLVLVVALLPGTAFTDEAWELGIQPFASPQALFQRYAPLREWLADLRQAPVHLEASRDFPRFIERLSEERYDVAIVAPHVVPLLGETSAYRPIARSRNTLAMIIVAPVDAPPRQLTDLEDATLATPARHSLGTRLARERIRAVFDTEDPPIHYLEFPHHNAAAAAMQRGLAEAAVLVIDARALESPRSPQEGPRTIALADGSLARILAQSDPFPGVTIVLHERVQTNDLDLQTQLLELSSTTSGQQRLRAFGHSRGFEPASPEDYEAFRSLPPDH